MTATSADAAVQARPTILFVHGMWGGGHQWADWQEAFRTRGFDSIAPTLRHHEVDPRGDPPAALGPVSLTGYCADLAAQIAELEAPPVIVGHSMGALLAQMLAARGLARAAVFLTPAPPAGGPAMAELLMPSVARTLTGTLLGAGLRGRPHRLSFKRAAYSCLNNLPEARQREEYGRWVWESGRVLFEIGFWWLDRARAARVDPKDVTVPTLTVAAGRDRITPKPVVDRIARRYAGEHSAYEVYPDHAHFLIREDGWERVAEDCAGWIEGALARSGEAVPAS